MSYIELYSEDILEAASLGKTSNEFIKSRGDFIKVEIVSSKGTGEILDTFYSNRLLLIDEGGNYYIGDYHYHEDHGFMVGSEHSDEPHYKLLPILEGEVTGQEMSTFNPNLNYRKQFEIYYDDSDRIYIKPNELLELTTGDSGTFYLRIYFLRDLKTDIGKFLISQRNNLIENGNFFAGLEATQTGDLDRSKGHNRFTMRENPGIGRFALEQTGAGTNEYDMMITGIEPSSDYVFSGWVAYNNQYEGDQSFVNFDSAITDIDSQEEQTEQTSWIAGQTFRLELKGRFYHHWPKCRVTLNGNLIADFEVTTDQWTFYDFTVPNIEGIDENTEIEIGVRYYNDNWGGQGSGLDRNLYFRKLVGPNNKEFTIQQDGELELLSDEIPQEDTSVLYYNLDGSLSNHYEFPGEFRTVMSHNGQVNTIMKSSKFFEFANTIQQEQDTGLILTPSPGEYITDEISTYKVTNDNNENNNRNLKIKTVNGVIWYKRYKLVSTTPDALLGSLRAHLGKSLNPQTNSNTLGRRYFTGLRFTKLSDFNNDLDQYISFLKTEED